MQQYIQDYLASKGITKDSSASFDYDSLHDLISGYTPPPSSHQGDFITDMEAEVAKRYSDPESEFAQDFEIGASWAKEYLSQPAPPTPVEGPWKLEITNLKGREDCSEKCYLMNGKFSVRIDGGTEDDSLDQVVNLLNAHKIELWSDDPAPLIISHLEEQVKELQGRKGLRWVNATEGLPDKDGEYCIAWSGGYYVAEYSIGLKAFYVSSRGTYPGLKVVRWLSDSPAPEQVHPIDFAEWLLTDGHINPAKGPMICVSDLYDKYTQQLNC